MRLGKTNKGIYQRRAVIVSPGDSDFFDNRLLKFYLSYAFNGVGEKFLRRQESDAEPALDHIQGGGRAGGAADDIRLETGFSAGIQAKLCGDLCTVMKNDPLVLQQPDGNPLLPGKRVIGGQGRGVMIFPQLDKTDAFRKLMDRSIHEGGDPAEHNRLLIETFRKLDQEGYDAIVMCQVSMRALLPELKTMKTPVLCSFYSGYGAVADRLNEIAAGE